MSEGNTQSAIRGLPRARTRQAATLVAMAAALAPAWADDFASPGQRYQMALEAQTTHDYAGMLALLRQAGQAGNLPAQEMLGTVLLAGPALYGDSVAADRCEAAQWLRRAADQGSELGRQQWRLLARLRHGPQGTPSCPDADG